MGTPIEIRVAEAMQRLWNQYLPQIQERVAVLESAALAVTNHTLSDEACASASAAAHKLAGVLGTFGLEEGTLLARKAESIYNAGTSAVASQSEILRAIASGIRALVASKK